MLSYKVMIKIKEHLKRIQRKIPLFLPLLLTISIFAAPLKVNAQTSFPAVEGFGFGGRISTWDDRANITIHAAAALGLDWVGVDIDWAEIWPESGASANIKSLDEVFSSAQELGIRCLVSITNPPEWAMRKTGPDPDITAGFVAQLVRLYPNQVSAVELFPRANTTVGWNTTPNPQAYLEIYKKTSATLHEINPNILLIAGGLVPINGSDDSSQVNDLEFLQKLYDAGAKELIPVISLRLSGISGLPIDEPGAEKSIVFRHYESIRSVMIENGHEGGVIWITGFSWPSDPPDVPTPENDAVNPSAPNAETQARWFAQAYQLVRSQLYIGVVFHSCLEENTNGFSETRAEDCLIEISPNKTSLHPAANILVQLNNAQGVTSGSKSAFQMVKKIHNPLYKYNLKTGVQ